MKMVKAIFSVFLFLGLAVTVSLVIGSTDKWNDRDG